MDRAGFLELLMLLSAMESWALSRDKGLPDYLYDRLTDAIDALRVEVLKGEKE